jgi:hypothetical protein
VQRPCVAAFSPARIVSFYASNRTANGMLAVVHGESWCVQAPVVARRPQVCQAAAEVVEAETAEPKGGVAHLRFKRGSVHKVGREQQ